MKENALVKRIRSSVGSLKQSLLFSMCALTTFFLVSPSPAATPTVSIWTTDRQTANASFDVLETNQWYAASHDIGFQATVMTAPSEAAVSITGLTFTCSLPSFVSPVGIDFNHDIPTYAQWNETYTSLVCQAATPLTNYQGWSSSVYLADTNVWIRPKINAKRSVSTTRLSPAIETEQKVVCEVFIPPGALTGMEIVSIQRISWDIPDDLNISSYSNTCSSSAFCFDPNNQVFFCTNPGSLSGTYSFTYYLKVTSYAQKAVNYVPGIQIFYSRTQTDWGFHSSLPARSLEHPYDNGIWVGVSSPIPILWYDQQMQDQVYWNIGSKYTPADADAPGLTQCFLFRAETLNFDGRSSPQFFINVSGTNLAVTTLTTPDDTTYAMETEPDEAYFEVYTLNESDLARFTNGIYTVKLYDYTNALRQTYSIPLTGTPVTETPHLLTPATLCSSASTPQLNWSAATDPNVNATVLSIDNPNLENNLFSLWMHPDDDPLPTTYSVDQDLFACWSYDLMFASASVAMVNGAQVLSGYLSGRHGFFNVTTENLAFVHVDTDAPRVFAGENLELDLTSFGFLPGSNYTYSVDFGDGFTTNKTSSVHPYSRSGTYTAHVIVTDNTGASATGVVAMAVYDPPTLSQISRVNDNAVGLTFPTIDAASYRLVYTDNLVFPSWSGTGTSLTGDGSTHMIQDYPDNSATQRFYRLECTLNPETDSTFQ